ncbi:anti-sigma factor family protein [Engelhardtia mirabilis]|uniref:Putative zinc-finger domain-containing protein n=1 Tax=Engelhardtia mirabilis TaxID=2528011 RepID=A0A518BG53_9BACT|nr:hypothetical protein Pla133_10270 [Planctomycetes bacterium Pla133]QDV00287.1 hypothetical protein Pla86_10260 [Planctomycetes bacterium Pla86]
MNCDEIRAWLPALRDDDLAARDRSEVEAHLSSCSACATERVRLDERIDLLAVDVSATAPRAHVDAVMAAVAREALGRDRRRPRWWLVTHVAAAAAGILMTWSVGRFGFDFGVGAGNGGDGKQQRSHDVADSDAGAEVSTGASIAMGGDRLTVQGAVASDPLQVYEPPRSPAHPGGTDGDGTGYTPGLANLVAHHPTQRRSNAAAESVHTRVVTVPVPLWLAAPGRGVASAPPVASDARADVSEAELRPYLEPLLAEGVALLAQMARAVERATFPPEGVDPTLPDDSEAALARSGQTSAPRPINGLPSGRPSPSLADVELELEPRRGPVTVRRDGDRIVLGTRGELDEVVPALLALLSDADPAVIEVVEGRLRSIARDLDRPAPSTELLTGDDADPWWRSARAAVADRTLPSPELAAIDRADAWEGWWRSVDRASGRSARSF